MDVRKFEAFSMQDAIKLVKRELGRDAVILSTREKTSSPDSGGKPVRLIEVTAAPAAASNNRNNAPAMNKSLNRSMVLSPEEAAKAQRINFPKVDQKNEVSILKNMPALGQLNSATRSLAKTIAGAFDPPSDKTNTNLPVPTRTSHLSSSEIIQSTQRNPQQQLNQNQPHLQGVLNRFDDVPSEEVKLLRDEISRVRREIEQIPHVNVSDQMQEIRVLLHDLMRQRYTRENESHQVHDESLNDLCIKLRAAGVLEAIISELTNVVTAGPRPTLADGSALSGERLREHYLNQSIRFLFRQMSVTPQVNFANQKIISLVGSGRSSPSFTGCANFANRRT